MDVSKITAIVELIDTGRAHEASGAQREAVKAYAEAYKGMQDTLVEVHALWVEAYQEMTRQAGPDFESTIPQAAENLESLEATVATDTVVADDRSEEPISENVSSPGPDESQDDFNVLSVSGRDISERSLSFKSVRSNPFAQAAKDLAAAVVEAATDVAAAVPPALRTGPAKCIAKYSFPLSCLFFNSIFVNPSNGDETTPTVTYANPTRIPISIASIFFSN